MSTIDAHSYANTADGALENELWWTKLAQWFATAGELGGAALFGIGVATANPEAAV